MLLRLLYQGVAIVAVATSVISNLLLVIPDVELFETS
jgi:hypothetical protein